MFRPGIIDLRIPFPLKVITNLRLKRPHLPGHGCRNGKIDRRLKYRLLCLDDITAIKRDNGIMVRNADCPEGRQDGIQRPCSNQDYRNPFAGQGPDRLYGRFADGMITPEQSASHIEKYGFIHFFLQDLERNLNHKYQLTHGYKSSFYRATCPPTNITA